MYCMCFWIELNFKLNFDARKLLKKNIYECSKIFFLLFIFLWADDFFIIVVEYLMFFVIYMLFCILYRYFRGIKLWVYVKIWS